MVVCISAKRKLLLLGAGIEQCEAIKVAQSLDLFVVAVDANPHAPGLKTADAGVCDDIKNVDKMTEIAKKYDVDGVMTHGVEIPEVVAMIAKNLGLPAIEPEVADRATDKLKRIECFTKHKVLCAKYATARNSDEAIQASRRVGYPCIFKPIDNSGARGVIKVDSDAQVKEAYAHTAKFTKELVILIEEFLQGREISTESIIYHDKVYTVALADRNYIRGKFEPYFIEDGGEMPTRLSADELEKVKKVVDDAIRALGIDWGVAKGDILIDSKGIAKVIEMAARTSGGRFCSVKVPLSTGINFLKPLMQMTVGLEPDLSELQPKFSKGVAERTIFVEPGIVTSISGIEDARRIEGVVDVHVNEDVNIGSEIKRITDNSMKKGYVTAVGKDREEAIRRAESAVEKIRIVTRKP